MNYEKKEFIADGYVMGEALLSEKVAKISGPKSYVSKVKSLVANVDIENKLKSTQSVDIIPTPIDSSGNTVDYITFDTEAENLPFLF